MGKKFFFFDIDGTLSETTYDGTNIPESTKLTLRKLEENGHMIAIATGRSYAMASGLMKDLGFSNMVSDGGYGLTINGELQGIEPLNYEDCLALIDECEEKGFIWAFSPDDAQRRLAPNDRFYDFTHDQYMMTVVQKGLNPRDYAQIYKVYIACYYPHEHELESLKKLPYTRFHKEYLFVEPKDKARGIKKMVDYFHGDYKDVVVFGDASNDLSMFLDEWTSIAMGNACDELKEKATYITTDVDKDGIYNACKHFGWI